MNWCTFANSKLGDRFSYQRGSSAYSLVRYGGGTRTLAIRSNESPFYKGKEYFRNLRVPAAIIPPTQERRTRKEAMPTSNTVLESQSPYQYWEVCMFRLWSCQ